MKGQTESCDACVTTGQQLYKLCPTKAIGTPGSASSLGIAHCDECVKSTGQPGITLGFSSN